MNQTWNWHWHWHSAFLPRLDVAKPGSRVRQNVGESEYVESELTNKVGPQMSRVVMSGSG